MPKLVIRLWKPATESQMRFALILAAIVVGLLLCGILWQSSIIGAQRDVIKWLWSTRAGA